MMATTFKQVSIPDLISDQSTRIVRDIRIFPSVTLSVPPIEFGDVSPEDIDVLDKDALLHWAASCIELNEVHAFRLQNAVVHPPYGATTLDQQVLRETLGHLPFHRSGYSKDGDDVSFPQMTRTVKMEEALSLLGGNSNNYFHWMLEILSRLQIAPFFPCEYTGPVLFPQVETGAQRDVLNLLEGGPNPIFVTGQDHAIQVESLLFIPNLVGYGYFPNPQILQLYDQLKRKFRTITIPTRRIYITRRDSANRVMSNESDVISMVQRYGFEIISLTNLSLAEQAHLFAGASHVIAPHGAGLTNIVFCDEGTRLCELHMSTYIRWFFRRLAGSRKMRYGCLVGPIDADSKSTGWAHTMHWSTPLDRLQAILDGPCF